VGKLEGKDYLEDHGLDGKFESKWTLMRFAGGCGVGSPELGYGPLAVSRKCDDEPSGSGGMELVINIYICKLFKLSSVPKKATKRSGALSLEEGYRQFVDGYHYDDCDVS
jgi:hypothetical protein